MRVKDPETGRYISIHVPREGDDLRPSPVF